MAEQGPPAFSRARHPLALRLVLSHKSISEDFFVNRDEATPSAPLVRSPKASLASDPNGGSSPTTTEARQLVLLVEMIPKVESEVFAQWRNATKGFSHRKVILVSHGRRDKEILSWRITLSLVKSSVRRRVPAHDWVQSDACFAKTSSPT